MTQTKTFVTHPLKTCCCPLASPASVVSFRIVCTPLSTVTWAIPAPMRPAPKMARVLLVGRKRQVTYIIVPFKNKEETLANLLFAVRREHQKNHNNCLLTSRLFEEFQSGSSCRRLVLDKDRSRQLTRGFFPADQNSGTDMRTGDVYVRD